MSVVGNPKGKPVTTDILLSQAVEGFLLARLADGYSPSTIAQYGWGLKMVTNQITKSLKDVTTDDLRRVMATVQAGELSPVSKFHVWKAIRAFYKWASAEGLSGRPDIPLTQPKFQLPEILPFTADEIKTLLKACDKTTPSAGKRKSFTMNRPQALRDKAIILTLLDTGVRASELCRLRVQDVDLTQGILSINPYRSGLKSRPRVIPIGQNTRKAIWRYWASREQKTNDPAFSTDENRPLDRGSLLHLIVRLGKRASINNTHPHRFRHTFAIMFLRNGGDVFTLQRLLGHSSLEMVRHYLTLASSDDENAHRRASPVDNWKL